jgi:hypothetical protein
MYKVCFKGAVTTACAHDSPRCESPRAAVARLKETLAAMEADPDPAHLYYFAFATHSGNFAPPRRPDDPEVAGTLAALKRLDALVGEGRRRTAPV